MTGARHSGPRPPASPVHHDGPAALTEEASPTAAGDFRRELAEWAVRSGWVPIGHPAELDEEGDDTRP